MLYYPEIFVVTFLKYQHFIVSITMKKKTELRYEPAAYLSYVCPY
jgi:hypothetical protein